MKSIVHSVKSPAWRCPWAGCAFVLASLLVGCASPSVTLPPQTLLIAEVSHVLTAEQVAAGGRGPAGQDDTMSVWAAKLHTPDQIARGRVFVLRSAIYWNNTVSGIEREGWQRPRTYWHKLPGAVPANAAPGGTTSPSPAVDAPSVPRGATPAADAGEGLSRLILRHNKGYEGALSVFALPVSIDDQQVSALDEGYCDLVLLAPGRHVVQAGTAAMGDPSGLPRLTLELDVTGGSRIVAE